MIDIALLAVAAFAQPGATEWRPLGETPDFSVTWDPGSVSRNGDRVSLRIRVDRKPPVQGVNAYATSELGIDCARSTSRVGDTTNYSSDGVAGNVVRDDLAWEPIPSGSFVADLRDAVCPAGR